MGNWQTKVPISPSLAALAGPGSTATARAATGRPRKRMPRARCAPCRAQLSSHKASKSRWRPKRLAEKEHSLLEDPDPSTFLQELGAGSAKHPSARLRLRPLWEVTTSCRQAILTFLWHLSWEKQAALSQHRFVHMCLSRYQTAQEQHSSELP